MNEMDKQDRRQITIVLNGKRNVLNGETGKDEVAATSEVGVEREIFESTEGTDTRPFSLKAFGHKSRKYPARKMPKAYHVKRKKRPRGTPRVSGNPLFRKLLLPLVAAIMIGTGLGVTVLMFFTKDQVAIGDQLKPADAGVDQGGTSTGAAVANVAFDPLQVRIVQGGVFSEKSAAEQAADQFKNDGKSAAVLEQEGKFFLLIGGAVSEPGIQFIANLHKEAGTSIYVKSLTIQGHEKRTAGAAIMKDAVAFYEQLLSQTSTALTVGTVEKDQLDQIQSTYDRLKKKEPKALEKEEKDLMKKLDNSYQSFSNWMRQGSKSGVWETQQALLDWLTAYNAWSSRS